MSGRSAEVDAYLARHGRDATSLLVASRLADDLALLREAVKADPAEPLGHLELALRSDDPDVQLQLQPQPQL